MGYKFPDDGRAIRDTVKQLDFDTVIKLKEAYKHEYELGLKIMEDLLETSEKYMCEICDKKDRAWGDLPQFWGYVDASFKWYLICDECQIRWAEKYNEQANVIREI